MSHDGHICKGASDFWKYMCDSYIEWQGMFDADGKWELGKSSVLAEDEGVQPEGGSEQFPVPLGNVEDHLANSTK